MKDRNIHIILASTLFAFLMWFSVSMSEQYQIQVSAPLIIHSVPPGKALSGRLPRAVRLTFNDYGWKLAKLTWGTRIEWTIDLSTLPPRTHALTLRDFYDQLSSQLGVLPISMSPESIYVTLDTLAAKRIAVTPRISATFREGYGQVGQIQVQPESVTVEGARSLLRQIDSWPTATRTYDHVRESIDANLSLADSIPYLTFVPKKVTLRMNVQQFAEKTFSGIPIELVSVPPNRDIILSSPKLELVVRGGMEELSRVNAGSFRAVIQYREILDDTSGIIDPVLNSPADIQIVKRTPEVIRYVIRKKM